MEVGTEISQKIRSAIKAKLIELGAYVDDELPDYIMVMVANKKTKDQMVSDLSLFLGTNTNTFAEWLHGLLSKLQTISVDPASRSGKEKKKDSKKEKKKSKTSKTGDGVTTKTKSTSQRSEGGEKKSVTVVDSGGNSETITKSKTSDDAQKEGSQTTLEVEDVRQMLVTVAPTDELAAELETTETRIEQSQTAKSKPVVSKRGATEGAEASRGTMQRKRSASSPEGERRVQSSIPKKHKGLSSVVANVSMNKEDDEEYDPLSPAVGSVASVVKVTTNRKSRLPPALQANSLPAGGVTEMEVREEVGSDSSWVRLAETASLTRIKTVLREILKEDDNIGVFCQSVAGSLRKMNLRDLAIAKLKIQKILFDYESCVQATKTSMTNSVCASQSRTGNSSSLSQDSNSNSDNTRESCDSGSVSSYVKRPSESFTPQSSGSRLEDSVSSSKNDQPSPHYHQAVASTSKATVSSSPATSEIDSSSSPLFKKSRCDIQPSTSSMSVPDIPPQTISLDSLHQKRRSEIDSATDSANKSSVLKIRPLLQNIQNVNSINGSGSCEVSGTDSPKPISAEQLKVLAKNLKITITNFRASESNSCSDETSSEESEEDSESEEESGDEKTAVSGANETSVSKDTEEVIPVTKDSEETVVGSNEKEASEGDHSEANTAN